MANFLDQIGAGSKLLWLDYCAYAGKLLSGGKIPWLDVSGLVAWQRKAQGLLKSDVVSLPLAPLIEAWLAEHPQLVKAMGEKERVLFPIKALLADSGLRAHLLELLAGLRSSFSRTPLALVMPSPRVWIRTAYTQAHGAAEDLEVGADEIDSASVYVADFLRAFGEAGIDILLLEEKAGDEPGAGEIEWYQPILNVAAHYRWDLGVRLSTAGADLGGLGFVIAPHPVENLPNGVSASAAFWDGEAAPACPTTGFLFAEVPAAASPEKVLDLVAALRR